MSNIDKRALRHSAESIIGILENIAGFEPSDIDGDSVELRFETEDGFDTGCDVSIVDQCQKTADVVRALLDELEAAEKRIAELESNEVREVGNQFLVVRHPGKTPVIKHCTGDLEEFLRKLIEQDPLVTIDIITHRYYGIGGQWVQDAVEYLHMMSDAGIRIKGE